MKFSYFNNYHLEVIDGSEDDIRKGYLLDSKNATAIPIVNNLIFSNEADIFSASLFLPKIDNLYTSLTGAELAYKQFIRTKSRKPAYDVYACFQPFNEALKSFYPFITPLKKQLQKGDIILDLWNRSGWSASLLAGLFPEQQIVTLWEGNKDVLGYKGFHHWFAADVDHIQVVFHDLNKPLPFADNSIALVYGLDALHRFDQSLMMRELLRVTKKTGAIICPHVHLSNAEPVPFFERGCRQLHGRQYDELFRAMADKDPNRIGFVFSEPGLFWFNEMKEGGQLPLVSAPDTTDYNALVALLPSDMAQNNLVSFSHKCLDHIEAAYILINPLFTINLSQQQLTLDGGYMAGAVGKLLARHPVYEERVAGAASLTLTETACKLLYLAGKLYAVGEIQQKLEITDFELEALLDVLAKHDIIQIVPVKQGKARLQQFLAVQEYVLAPEEQTLPALWNRAGAMFGENIFISVEEDGSEFTYADIDILVKRTMATLQAKDIQKGDRICLVAPLHLEQLVMFWAAVHSGVVVVPLGHDLPEIKLHTIFEEIRPSLIVTDHERLHKIPVHLLGRCILLDQDIEVAAATPSFSDWIIDEAISIHPPAVTQHDLGVILYTSGSTGTPKGVMLTQGNLVRSARLMTETFAWEAKDIFYAIGDLDSMSGLRNSCIAPVETGAAIFIPQTGSKHNARDIAASISRSGATIIAASPVILKRMLLIKDEVRPLLSRLRLVLSTGSQLNSRLKEDFFESFQTRIYNYYGLTETTGICISESPVQNCVSNDTIGKPLSCIAQVVDDAGNVLPQGAKGALRIYSENIMNGYWNRPAHIESPVTNGWLYTGDIAEIMEDGSIRLLGRKQDFIKSTFSEIIYTHEVENTLLALPEIKEVSACGFFSDDSEKMAVFIVPAINMDIAEMVSKVKNYLADVMGIRKIPSVVKVVDQLPYGANHKVLKNRLIELL